MNVAESLATIDHPALRRIAALAPLGADERSLLHTAMTRNLRTVPARRDLAIEGRPVDQPLIVLEGWAFRSRILNDGRRLIFDFLVPGDLIGFCAHKNPLAMTTISTLNPVTVCVAPQPLDDSVGEGLAEAYAVSHALEQRYWLRQMTRLGRLTAYERVIDWALEMFERCHVGEAVWPTSLRLPITQEVLGDTLGLTSVHVNRTLKALMRDGLLQIAGGKLTLLDRERCTRIAGIQQARVSGASLYR
ncbi:Crp/Fnr family transcriptional regulator [uncultured Sphingomonas sp.]|uniref:Crp/Fnr family transcriptional regulator n=1 Tax=uncultured Sphingomonas sp. TaxID=158754 RepID=UPI0035CA692A